MKPYTVIHCRGKRTLVFFLVYWISFAAPVSAYDGYVSGGFVEYGKTSQRASSAYLKKSWKTYQRITNDVAESQFRALVAAAEAASWEAAKTDPVYGDIVKGYKFANKVENLAEEIRQKDIIGVSAILTKEIGIMSAKAYGELVGGGVGFVVAGPAGMEVGEKVGGTITGFVAVASHAYLDSIGTELGAAIGEMVYE